MPIVIECNTCGAKMKAPDTAAGKKVKCPKCEAILTVPAAGSSPQMPAVPAPAPAPPPLPPAAYTAEKQLPATTDQDYPAEDEEPYEDDYEDDRPRRKKKTKKKGSGSLKDAGSKKITAGILALLLNSLGIHKFYLGYTGAGLIMLLVSLLSCGLLAPVMGIIGLIEGIIYLTKSDEEFYETYIADKKEWF